MVYSNHNVHHRRPSICQICLLNLVAHDNTVELFVVDIFSCMRNSMCLECDNCTCQEGIITFINISKEKQCIFGTPAYNNYMLYPRLQVFNETMCNALEIYVCPFFLFLNVGLCPSFSRLWLPIWYLQTLLSFYYSSVHHFKTTS